MSKPNEKVHMLAQDAQKRKNNFSEVATGLTEELALQEAERCLNCKNPLCMTGCPVGINIPKFIQLIKEK